ncbi:hypothetical protein HDU97_007978 [Phlyctochytrium planicorne]|nr:hypothetical protein HDU97_007978 [Phlyctochytrium planicorne]
MKLCTDVVEIWKGQVRLFGLFSACVALMAFSAWIQIPWTKYADKMEKLVYSLFLVSTFKIVISLGALIPNTSKILSLSYKERILDFMSMILFGLVYGVLDAFSFNPYNIQTIWSPSLPQLAAICLIPSLLVFKKTEKLSIKQWISLGLLGASLAVVSRVAKSDRELVKCIFTTTHAILRVLHSLELKRNKDIPISFMNIITSASAFLVYTVMFLLESSGVLKPSLQPAVFSSVPGWIMTMFIQAGVELMATVLFRHSNAAVGEMGLIFGTLLTALAPSAPGEIFEITYVRFVALCLGTVAVCQYFSEEAENDSTRNDYENIKADNVEIQPIIKSRAMLIITAVLVAVGCIVNLEIPKDSTQLSIHSAHEDLVFKTPVENFDVSQVHRNRLKTTDENFYEEFSIVIPSFMPHREFLFKLFQSMEKYCLDCEHIKFLIVVSNNAVEEFASMRNDFPFLKRLEVLSFPQVYPDLADPVLDLPEPEFYRLKEKCTFQSMKKLQGCLHMNTTYCWMLDSESFMFQTTSVKEMVETFFNDPHIVYSSHDREFYPATIAARDILGLREHFGWALEEYLWFMEMDVLRNIKKIMDAKFPTARDLPVMIFIEVVYFLYIIHNIHAFPEYRIIDSANLFGQMWDYTARIMRPPGLGPVEDIRHMFKIDPTMVEPMAARYNSYGINFFKSGGAYGNIEDSAIFLDLATSLTMCVSEQAPELYQMAMEGRWANRVPTLPAFPVMDFCLSMDGSGIC